MKYTSGITQRNSLVFSLKFWLVTLLLLLIYSTMLFAQYTNTIYLDPTNSGDPGENGTIEHPYDDITDVSISSNTQYLFKRGTTMEITSTITIGTGVNYIKFSDYGTGSKPVIHKITPNSYNIRIAHSTTDIVIESIDIKGYTHVYNGGVTNGVYIDPGLNGGIKNILIKDCDVYNHGVAINSGYFGIEDQYIDSVSIINCNVYDCGLDGIFFRNTRYGLIEGCHIYDVNLYWHTSGSHEESPSGGDCIQITRGAYDFKIYNNILDRRSTGNKFCFIFGGYEQWMGVRGEIIGNTFYPPKDTTDDHGGGVFFISQHATQYIKIERNYFCGRADNLGNKTFRGIGTMRADTTLFSYNIIDSISIPGNIPGQSGYCEYAEVNNNTMVSGGHTGIFDILTVSPNTYAEVKNNLTAGDGDHPLIYIMGVPSYNESNNIQLQSSNTSIYNSTLSIVSWETGDFHRTTDLNDGVYVGIQYDFDSVFVSNPPEIGTCEYFDGGQTNNPPNIDNQAFSIDENMPNGTQVGLIIATDPDQGQTLTYSIQSGNTDNAFAVNSATGELTVNNVDALDYETNPEFNLTVQVQDNGLGSLTDQAIITINLININEIDQPATWIGNNSTNWNIATNWDTGLVPDENTIVYISGGLQYYPAINSGEINIGINGNGTFNCRTISINNGGKFEISTNNSINIDSLGSITINDGGMLNIGGDLNVFNNGRLNILGGMITCTYDGKENGNIRFYSGSGGFMNNGSITVFRSLQFFPGTNWTVIQGTIYCGGTSDEVLIIQQDENLALNNLKINDGVSAQFVSDIYSYPLIINGDFKLGINSEFTNNNGKVITVGGKFIMESNEYGSASLVNYGSINTNGQIEVQDYLEADRWHYISTPLSDDTAGVFMNMYLYSFDETSYNPNTNTPSGWINIVDENTPLNVGEGYKVWSYSSMPGSQTISFTKGILNDGIISLPVNATDQDFNSIIGDGEGWNLVGNPYSSGVDWNHQSWVKQNIDGSVYVFDGVQYLVWPGNGDFGTLTNGVIPAMQAFFVKANGFNPSLIIANDSRVHGESSYKESTINNLLVLSVDGNDYNDKTFINFNVNGSDGFDTMLDAYKIKGISEAPQLYTFANGKILTINVLPELLSDTVVSMGLEVGSNTEYVITADMLESFGSGVEIYLEDKLQARFIDLRKQNTYRFVASPVDDSERFSIHFILQHGFENDESKLNDYLIIYSNKNKIYIRNLLDNPVNTEFFLFNISGREIKHDKMWIEDIKCIPVSAKSGFYVVMLISEKDIFTEKIFIK